MLIAPTSAADLDAAVEEAAGIERLHALIVAVDGREIVAEAFRGPDFDTAVNVKSVAKTAIAALVGAAIHEGVLEGPDQPIVPLLGDSVPRDAAPELDRVTIGHLLSMRAGLERTSGANYGGWVMSGNWVRNALARPFVAEPGGRMLYSTGNSHLLSAILTRASGRSTLDLARDWLGGPLGIEVPAWQRDPQGIYFGGNNMALSPRALIALGELYREGGMAGETRVFAEDWVARSWTPRARSRFTGDRYGYGWFVTELAGHDVRYAWGYGGQMLYVAPDLDLTVAITSDSDAPSGGGYVRDLHRLMEESVIPAVEGAEAEEDGEGNAGE